MHLWPKKYIYLLFYKQLHAFLSLIDHLLKYLPQEISEERWTPSCTREITPF